MCLNCFFFPQTVMVSLEGLTKIVDPSQLTADFEGSLEYNHDDWIEVLMLRILYFILWNNCISLNLF